MRPSTRRSAMIAIIISIAVSAWGQDYLLYSPQPVTSEQKDSSKEGILVQEIEIQKGDTLYGLSRKFSGKGMYFPQILLFNSLKSPDLIYPGNTLKIPVPKQDQDASQKSGAVTKSSSRKHKGEALPVARQAAETPSAAKSGTELSLNDLKTDNTNNNVKSRHKKKKKSLEKKTAAHEQIVENIEPTPLPVSHKNAAALTNSSEKAGGQKLFESAVKAYRRDDCREAIELLDRYLADNSTSPLAADASLYRAECYLKLSVQ